MVQTVTKFKHEDVLALRYRCPRCDHDILSINNTHVGWSYCGKCRAALKLSDEMIMVQMAYVSRRMKVKAN